MKNYTHLPSVLFITSYPPRECGIATYTKDLVFALHTKFINSFKSKICALENSFEKHKYPQEVKHILETDNQNSYIQLANDINNDDTIDMVLIQHEFGLFKSNEIDFIHLLKEIQKPIILVFHTVLPQPNDELLLLIKEIELNVDALIVMTKNSFEILVKDYKITPNKITIIPHGTHLVKHLDKTILKEKYNVIGKKVLSTFGLLSAGKSIETTLDALQHIRIRHPDVLFLILGKTHPNVIKNEGEIYRLRLEAKINELQLNENVLFINRYLSLDELLEYLQLTDLYLFTSKDRNQAVSGTFSYAISCGCPIISTPIPHAKEVLDNGTGIIIDFENSTQLAEQVNLLLEDDQLRASISINGIHKLAPTSWENTAISYALLLKEKNKNKLKLHYKIPPINLNHLKKMTTSFGLIQFSILNQPNLETGYTLDDNARALIAICKYYKLKKREQDLEYIYKYFDFIKYCFQSNGYFLNYVNPKKEFTQQNNENLADANGRAIWALGYVLSNQNILPDDLIKKAHELFELSLQNVYKIDSPRALAFIIKGIYYCNLEFPSILNKMTLIHLADNLVQMYHHESKENWQWYESYLTYGNSLLPEALLYAYLISNNKDYKTIAESTFEFLLSFIYNHNMFQVISNKGWLHYGHIPNKKAYGGEQPIDIAYTLMTLNKFYEVFGSDSYLEKMKSAFDWFLGHNHLHQIIYNPCTGGCCDGLEDTYINLNQGAESTVSYLLARLTIEKYAFNRQLNVPYSSKTKNKKWEKKINSTN